MSIDAIKATPTSKDYTNSGIAPANKVDAKVRDEETTTGTLQSMNKYAAKFSNEITSKDYDKDKEENGNAHSAISTSEAVKKAINEINKSNPNSIVQFGVHEATNRMTIKILDKESRKVIKEFPAEKTLDLIAKAWELAGIMVDEKR